LLQQTEHSFSEISETPDLLSELESLLEKTTIDGSNKYTSAAIPNQPLDQSTPVVLTETTSKTFLDLETCLSIIENVIGFLDGIPADQRMQEINDMKKTCTQLTTDIRLKRHELACSYLELEGAKEIYTRINGEPKAYLGAINYLQEKIKECQKTCNEIQDELREIQKTRKQILNNLQQKQKKPEEKQKKPKTKEKKSEQSSEFFTFAQHVEKTYEATIQWCEKKEFEGKERADKGQLAQQNGWLLLMEAEKHEAKANQLLQGEATDSNIDALIQTEEAAAKCRSIGKRLIWDGKMNVFVGTTKQSVSKEAKNRVQNAPKAACSTIGSECYKACHDKNGTVVEKCIRVVSNTGTSVLTEGAKSVAYEGFKGGVIGLIPALGKRLPGIGGARKLYTLSKSALSSNNLTEAGSNIVKTGLQMGGQAIANQAGEFIGGAIGTGITIALPILCPPLIFLAPAAPFIGAAVGGAATSYLYDKGAEAFAQTFSAQT
jgi:hypothetical protein